MVRVGVDASFNDDQLSVFPPGVELVRIPPEPVGELAIEFWIPPFYPKTAQRMLPHLKCIKVVQSLLAGVDWLLQLLPQGAVLCDGQGVHDISTAEWAAAAVLAMQKYLPFYVNLQQREDWRGRLAAEDIYRETHQLPAAQPSVLVDELAGNTLLIVGYGSIGRALEVRLAPFGVRFLRVARTAREGVAAVEQLDALLPQADIVVLMLPLTEETRHLIDRQRIARLKHGALLVNAARGPVVDTDALLEALHARRIRAAIDVTDPEPLPAGHPLWKAPNLMITPHVAGASARFIHRGLKLASEQVKRYIDGEPLRNVVRGGY